MKPCHLLTLFMGAIALSGSNFASAPTAQANLMHVNPHSNPIDQGHHHHDALTVPAQQPQPSVDLIVHPDAVQGWNLELKVTNFTFAPERINTASNPQEGHAHLYINGQKITRLYSTWYYLSDLEPGQHQIKVTLNANGHEALVSQDQPVEDTETITVGDRP